MRSGTLLETVPTVLLRRRTPEVSGTLMKIPMICPITDLARDARRLVERARQRQEPIVITQRGRDAAVLVPIELYRKLESQSAHRIVSPRLVHPEDAERFTMSVEIVDSPDREADAGL
jgi:prevent-host-death family protein